MAALAFRLRSLPSQQTRTAWAIQTAAFSSSSSSSAAAGGKKLLVFGGNGFLGQEICKTALDAGFKVVSVSHQSPNAKWASKVEWIKADVFDHDVWAPQLKDQGIDAAVSTIGGIKDNQRNSTYYNGDSNETILTYAPKFETFVYLGAQKYGFPVYEVLRGYYRGKLKTEKMLFEVYGDKGVSLQLPFVYGEGRQWPVNPALQFLKSFSEAAVPKFAHPWIPSLRPPMSKEDIARAVIRSVQINLRQIEKDPVSGKVEYEKIQELAKL